MGSVSHFNVRDLTTRYGCTTFVETGTGAGDSLMHVYAVAGDIFGKMCSTEINQVLWKHANARFANCTGVHVLFGNSAYALAELLPVLAGERVLWWLDAHFPGADCGLAAYEDEKRDTVRMPLAEELRLIKGRPGGCERDVVLIDDARLFLDAENWGAGPLKDRYKALVPKAMGGVGWIRGMFSGTHTLTIDYADQGYISVLPKGV